MRRHDAHATPHTIPSVSPPMLIVRVPVLARCVCVFSLLSMFARVQEKGDGYFYGAEELLDRLSESSGRQHHQRHHHGSSLLCTAGLEAECSFCGCNSAAA